MATLPTNIDATYADDPEDASVKEHQQYHDEVHRGHNTVEKDATVDGVNVQAFIEQPTADANGFVVKVHPDAPSSYGRGQAFMVLAPGAGDATDDSNAGSVLFRIDHLGGVGFTGGLHVATGLRTEGPGGASAVWIDPANDTIPLLIHNPTIADSDTWTRDYVHIVDTRNANEVVFKIDSTGAVISRREIRARDGAATRTYIGNIFGFAGINMGINNDTFIYRDAAGVAEIYTSFQMREMTTPAAPVADKARIFVRDDGAGNTQLCVIFADGAVNVLATQ